MDAFRTLLVVASLAALVLCAGGCPSRVEDQAPPDGAALYGRYCALCHGGHGEGYAADSAPQLANAELLASATDDFLTRAICRRPTWHDDERMGARARWPARRCRGRRNRRPHARLAVEALRRSLRVKITGDVTRGEEVYASRCADCHGRTGVDGPFLRIAGPELLASASDGFLEYAIAHGRPSTQMSPYAGKIDRPVGRRRRGVAAELAEAASAR